MWLNGSKIDIAGVLKAAEKPARRFGRVEKLQRVIMEVALELDAGGEMSKPADDRTIAQWLVAEIVEGSAE